MVALTTNPNEYASHCVDTCQMGNHEINQTMMCHSIYLNKKINAFRLSKFVEIIGIG